MVTLSKLARLPTFVLCVQLDAPIDYRYMATMELSDHTAAQWVTAFGEAVSVFLCLCVCTYAHPCCFLGGLSIANLARLLRLAQKHPCIKAVAMSMHMSA